MEEVTPQDALRDQLKESGSLDRTKSTFTCRELDIVIGALEANYAEFFRGYGVEDKEMYQDYLFIARLINRLKRAYARVGGEAEIEAPMNITAWAKHNNLTL